MSPFEVVLEVCEALGQLQPFCRLRGLTSPMTKVIVGLPDIVNDSISPNPMDKGILIENTAAAHESSHRKV